MELLQKILNMASVYPDLTAAVVGIVLSMAATQFIKKLFPDNWSDHKYRVGVQLTGFFTGWIFTHGAWALFDHGASHFEKLYASAGCGFASPAIYSFLSAYLSKKYSWFETAFSGRPAPKQETPSDQVPHS
jgi:hypothetical protein